MRPSSTRSHAIRNAASGVRLALRVCSIHSVPFSTVNSKSWASWKSASSRLRTCWSWWASPGTAAMSAVGVTRGVATGHDVLALGVEEEVDVEAVLSGGRVPREADARSGVDPHVAEHHRLDDHRRPGPVVEPRQPAIVDGSGCGPGPQHRLDRAAQLVHRILRERMTGERAVHILEIDRRRPAARRRRARRRRGRPRGRAPRRSRHRTARIGIRPPPRRRSG